MSSVNKTILIGNVGKDPEVNTTQSGAKFAKFSMATNRKWKDKNGQLQQDTQWHRVTCWFAGLVNVVEQYLNGGDRVYVEGRLEYNEFTTREGVQVRDVAVVAQELVLLGNRRQNNGNGESDGYHKPTAPVPTPAPAIAPPATAAPATASPTQPTPAATDDDWDDVPF